ncbi:Erythromycin esterase [Penicillium chermesinum]|uniref:Erythromycin esterase n=1 Tax=Penicillium chermesinum TaxID=63820 RepID=A0A9W9TWM5_9EURO|nr:Erythromycin esterase [Penicillium chermesinum]KAJ5246531.1 Erythromycin esterase [Penicillium chermesinum]KAJ6144799.1 Erythromycin esterase [Penicillium chermesinum]
MSQLQDQFDQNLTPLPEIDDKGFGSMFDSFAGPQVVMLGDGSHGTSEFYSARAQITKRFIEKHGYTMVAVEADWPDAEAIDRYTPIGGVAKGEEPFKRFPTWMWRNREMQELVEWMRDWNKKLPPHRRVGFYGLDLYSMGASIRAVIDYLDAVDPAAAKEARKRYGCLQPWVDDPTAYGLHALRGMQNCEAEVMDILRGLLERRLEHAQDEYVEGEEGDRYHSSKQNAYLVKDAEKYYRAMYWSSASSWTLRDLHMFESLHRLLQHRPPTHKAIVWAHNSHVGDARYTSMGIRRHELNIGQLCRERLGRQNVAILGCGTHTGTVAAADEWDEDMQVMDVVPSQEDSWEIIAHNTGVPRFLLDFRRGYADPALRSFSSLETRLERFIGVIYRPDTERLSHYSHAQIHEQFDGYIWFDETKAVEPIETMQPQTTLGKEETYPFGL